jgi:hypothetical protein
MRQVFTSPRLENVEKVARLLEEHDIEVRITDGRSFRGNHRRAFSYRERGDEGPKPAVWVVRSDDHPKARAVLREIGLLESSRGSNSYLPDTLLARDRDSAEARSRKRAFRIRAGLLIAIALSIGLGVFLREPAPPSSTATSAAPSTAPSATQTDALLPAATADGGRYIVDTPSALAAMLIDIELRSHDAALACLSVDGADPSENVLRQLQAEQRTRARPQSACTDPAADAIRIGVRDYRTDGSGSGSVSVDIARGAAGADRDTRTRTLEVRRDVDRWQVLSGGG